MLHAATLLPSFEAHAVGDGGSVRVRARYVQTWADGWACAGGKRLGWGGVGSGGAHDRNSVTVAAVALGLLGLDGTGVVQTWSEKVDGPAWHPRVRPQHPAAGHLHHALAMLSASCSFNLLPLNQICHRTQLLVAVAKAATTGHAPPAHL